MNIRRSIFWFITIVVVLIALAIWFGKRKSVETQPVVSVGTNAASPVIAAPSQPMNVPVMSIQTNWPASKPAPNVVQTPEQAKWGQMQQILATQNDIPIDFYCRVEDQFGNAVANATVNFSVTIYNGYESAEKRGQTTTDGNGFFSITGYKGQDLGIMPEKAGYVLATTRTLFKYSHLEKHPYVSDQNNPTVIKMWKQQGAEQLIHFQTEARIPIDGTSAIFNLETGKQVDSGGDIIIQIKSSLKPNVVQRYDWQATVQAVGGGLILSDADFDQMFQAPESGYESKFDINYQEDVKPWTTTYNGDFYFSSRNGSCYGKLGIEILSDVVKDGAVPVILNSYVNPTGSRNLEIDPSKLSRVTSR